MIELLLIGSCPAEPGTPAYERYECKSSEPATKSGSLREPKAVVESEAKTEKYTSDETIMKYSDKKVGHWLIYQAFEGSCAALVGVKGGNSQKYNASQTYIFHFARDFSDGFNFPSKSFKYYNGSEKTLLLKFDRPSSISVAATHYADASFGVWRGKVSNKSWFRQNFVDANSVSLFLDGQMISQTNLADSSAAMREVEVCLASPGEKLGE